MGVSGLVGFGGGRRSLGCSNACALRIPEINFGLAVIHAQRAPRYQQSILLQLYACVAIKQRALLHGFAGR
jgi:hypothetical protein